MRRSLLLLFVMLAVAACSSGSSSNAPNVTIDSTDVDGSTVTLVFSVESERGAPSFKVAWGDGTAEPPVEGQGQFVLTHEYDSETADATVSIEATNDDGVVGSATALVTLVAGTSTTVVALDTTTTTISDTTTTTVLETTTTTLADTTTTTAPTTTSTSTTTTKPAPVTTEFHLDVSTGVIAERWGDGAKQSTWNGATATAEVKRHDNAWEHDGIRVTFPIPKDQYWFMTESASSLVFEFTAYIDSTYTLDTDKSDGNEAKIEYSFTANKFLAWAGETYRKSIEEDRRSGLTASAQEMSGDWGLSAGQFHLPQTISFELQCSAKGPGGILVGSDSECDAEIYVVGIEVRVTGEG